MDRRGFLKLIGRGVGAGAAAVLPVDELLDRLAFARSPTTSIYVPRGPFDYGIKDNAVQRWADSMLVEYIRANSMHRIVPVIARLG